MIKGDMKVTGVGEGDVEDWDKWRSRTMVPNSWGEGIGKNGIVIWIITNYQKRDCYKYNIILQG